KRMGGRWCRKTGARFSWRRLGMRHGKDRMLNVKRMTNDETPDSFAGRALPFGIRISGFICHSSFFPGRSLLKDTGTTDPAIACPKGVARGQWLVLIAAFLGWMFDGLEMGIFPLVARPALQDMMQGAGGGDQFVGLWMGRITALFLVGAACGGLTFGWLGDRIGRVRSMSLSILTYSIFTGLCFFAQEPWQLGALRFVAAFGMGGEWSLGVALVRECWPRDKRPLLAGIIG